MKKLIPFMLLLFMCSLTSAQKTFFSCDFNNGIPESFALYDGDGNTPSEEATQMGFEVGKPWISYCAFKDEPSNLSVVSTSSYSPEGTSNDWIVTPAIPIESADAYFMWKAGNFTDKKDGYKIMVSTKGQSIEDFTDAEVIHQTKKGENEALIIYTHIVSLKEYAGKTIYIAVVNNSTNKSFLMMDDFWVGELFQSVGLVNNIATNVLSSDKDITIKCSLINDGLIKFQQNVTVTLDIHNTTTTKDIAKLVLAPREAKEVLFTQIPAPAEGESSNYTITATYTDASGKEVVKTINSALFRIGSVYSKKFVVEEGTGTWCGYCPRGMVGMKAMRKKHPDDFIGIAVHDDIMRVEEYIEGITPYVQGFPIAIINRSSTLDPSTPTLESQYKKEIIKPSVASVKIRKAEFGDKDSTLIRVNVSSSFAFNADRVNQNFRYAFVIIENDVKGTSPDYDQTNYYADGAGGRMGGFESLPDPVPASEMSYQEVARFITSFNGIEESLPQTVEKDKETLYEYTFPTPKNIFNKKNIEVIVLLIDQITGEIWNADKIGAKEMEYNSSINSIGTTEDTNNNFKTYVVDGDLLIVWNSSSTTPLHVEIFGLDGKKVKDVHFANVLEGTSIPVNDLKGMYVIKMSNGKDTAVKKIIL